MITLCASEFETLSYWQLQMTVTGVRIRRQEELY